MIKEIRMPLSEYEQLKEIERKYRDNEQYVTVTLYEMIGRKQTEKYLIKANSHNISDEIKKNLDLYIDGVTFEKVYLAEQKSNDFETRYLEAIKNYEETQKQMLRIPKWIRNMFA